MVTFCQKKQKTKLIHLGPFISSWYFLFSFSLHSSHSTPSILEYFHVERDLILFGKIVRIDKSNTQMLQETGIGINSTWCIDRWCQLACMTSIWGRKKTKPQSSVGFCGQWCIIHYGWKSWNMKYIESKFDISDFINVQNIIFVCLKYTRRFLFHHSGWNGLIWHSVWR